MFRLQGCTYFQQTLRCNKVLCATCRAGWQHGRYWFVRSPDGKTKYIGNLLPLEIEEILHAHSRLVMRMDRVHRELMGQIEVLQRQMAAVERLRRSEAFQPGDEDILCALDL